jgi:hypothetical protein
LTVSLILRFNLRLGATLHEVRFSSHPIQKNVSKDLKLLGHEHLIASKQPKHTQNTYTRRSFEEPEDNFRSTRSLVLDYKELEGLSDLVPRDCLHGIDNSRIRDGACLVPYI